MNYNAHLLTQKRTSLQDVVPLATPFTILIEVSRLCNFRCVFCPQSDNDKFPFLSQNILDMDTLKRIVKQMGEFPDRIKKVYMHGTGESMLNPHLPEMIEFLKKSNVTESVDLTSNGALLSEQLGKNIVEAGLDHLHISVEALSSAQYAEVTGVANVDFKEIVKNVSEFSRIRKNCRLSIKIASTSVKKKADRERFFSIFSPLCDEIFIENIFPIWPDFRLNNLVCTENNGLSQYGQTILEKEVCPQIFTVLAVKSDGSVSPCSVDWCNKNVFGNVNVDTLRSIWNSELLKIFRLRHLVEGRQKLDFCASCGLPKYSCIDNLDRYRQEIIEKIK